MYIDYPNITKIIQKLKEEKQTISFAESCTGGRLAAIFTSVSGASNVFYGSVVSYSNEIKKNWLGVTQEILDKHGAVSKECVSQMLEGIIKMSDADYAIAISGIAGPTGGTAQKPVGTVYIGLYTPLKQEIFHSLFKGNRETIQKHSTDFALKKLEKLLEI